MLLGQDGLEQELMTEATTIAEEIAQNILSTGDCGRVREMLHSMQQLMLMGGNETLIEGLRNKIDRLYRNCDLWIGTVRFLSFSSPTHPGLGQLTLHSGGCWSETHEIKMAIHAGDACPQG